MCQNNFVEETVNIFIGILYQKIKFPLFYHPSISQMYLWIPPKLYDRGSCIITQRGTFILYICGHVLAYC